MAGAQRAIAIAVALVALGCPATSTPCHGDADCVVPAACKITICGDDVCEAAPERDGVCKESNDGEACAENFTVRCAPGFACAEFGDEGGTEGTCVPTADRSDGEPCTTTSQCAAPLTCITRRLSGTVGGKCVETANRTSGEPCASTQECAAGLTCGASELCL